MPGHRMVVSQARKSLLDKGKVSEIIKSDGVRAEKRLANTISWYEIEILLFLRVAATYATDP